MRKMIKVMAVAATMTLACPSGAYAGGQVSRVSEAVFTARMLEFVHANPADVEGFTKLAESLGGQVRSSSSTLYVDQVPGLSEELRSQSSSGSTQGDFPQDVFTVNIRVGSVGKTKIVTGSFDWRDNFAGQASPYDIAALRFSSGCGGPSSLSSSTKSVRGVVTDLASLRDAGVGTNAPMWNVDARTIAFENQADTGGFSAVFDMSKCGTQTVRAAFDYEGNQGGSLVSASAGWGGLSVSYSSPGLTLRKSTQAVSLN